MNEPPDDSLLDDPVDSALAATAAAEEHSISQLRIAFIGKLGGMSRREAMQLVRNYGAVPVEPDQDRIDVWVIGAEESPLAEAELLDQVVRDSAARGDCEVIHETELWQRLGLVDQEQAIQRLYTPAMLADLLGVSVRIIRRWHRRGLIVPVRTVHRLPYFDFQEVSTARRLAELVAAGASPQAIEKRLNELSETVPDVSRPLAQLSILIEGKQILLRQGEGLIEPGGQLRFDFDAFDQAAACAADQAPSVVPLPGVLTHAHDPFLAAETVTQDGDDPLLFQAYAAEDEGDLETAVDCHHAILARDGASAEMSFQLGELLYRQGEISAARERYFMAMELDESFVEARANLAAILAETGRLELAVAAFRGTLELHEEYPDVHYNLARTLDELGRPDEAQPHWRRFLQLAPDSPWADEAKQRLRT